MLQRFPDLWCFSTLLNSSFCAKKSFFQRHTFKMSLTCHCHIKYDSLPSVCVPGTTAVHKVRANIVSTFLSISSIVYYAVRDLSPLGIFGCPCFKFCMMVICSSNERNFPGVVSGMRQFRLSLDGVSLSKDFVSLSKDLLLSKEGRDSSSSLTTLVFRLFVGWTYSESVENWLESSDAEDMDSWLSPFFQVPLVFFFFSV